MTARPRHASIEALRHVLPDLPTSCRGDVMMSFGRSTGKPWTAWYAARDIALSIAALDEVGREGEAEMRDVAKVMRSLRAVA